MPFYDLRCDSCDKEFNIMASMSDKTQKLIPCPECGSLELETVYKSGPYVLKGGGVVPECPNSHVCSSGCCHAKRA